MKNYRKSVKFLISGFVLHPVHKVKAPLLDHQSISKILERPILTILLFEVLIDVKEKKQGNVNKIATIEVNSTMKYDSVRLAM